MQRLVSDVQRLHLRKPVLPELETVASCGEPSDPATSEIQLLRLHGRETLLIVNDAAAVRYKMVVALRQFGYRVLEAVNGMEAQYHAHSQRQIHLMLIDLPARTVWHRELVRWFHAIYPQTKILLTTDSIFEVNLQSNGSRQVVILAQPFTLLELASMVRRMLDDSIGMKHTVGET